MTEQPQSTRVLETAGVLVSRVVHPAGAEVPWHFHDEIRDTFFLIRGRVTIHTRRPDSSTTLTPGEVFQTGAGQPHRVVNDSAGEAELLLIQGVGQYDFHQLPE